MILLCITFATPKLWKLLKFLTKTLVKRQLYNMCEEKDNFNVNFIILGLPTRISDIFSCINWICWVLKIIIL